MKKIYYIITLAAGLWLSACTEKQIAPISAATGTPDAVTDVQTEPIAGGVIVKYRIPNVEDILGVKAVYQLSNGKKAEKLASFYQDEMTLEGFIDEDEHTATLYVLNRAMQESEPVEVTFRPKQSALSRATQSMTITRDFGGAQYSWANEDRGQLNLELIAEDSTGLMVPMRILTTSSKEGQQSLHGYNTDPRWFAAVFRDNFGNVSDTIFPVNAAGERMRISPLYEEKIDKKGMEIMLLNNDRSFSKEGTDAYLIDDDVNTYGHTEYSNALPAAVTIDLGQKVKVSRIVVHARPYGGSYYSWGNPRNFTVYTCDHKPSQSGDWSEWNKIMDCEVIKPSGMNGKDTDEDTEAGQNGAGFSFPLDADPTRYIRLNVTKIWTNNQFCHIAEITIYGDPGVE